MIFTALEEAAGRGELFLVQDGLLRYHLRRDGQVTIREVLVLPFRRRTGVGRRLIAEVRRKHPSAPIVARCPAGSEANLFWAAIGFRCEPGEGLKGHWRNLSESGDRRDKGAHLECFCRSMAAVMALWRRHGAVANR